MKKNIRFSFSLIILLAFVFGAFVAKAEGTNKMVVMGQITTKTYGNPLKDHKVFIVGDSVAFNSFYYYKEILTDENGYYYDTIYTDLTKGSFTVYTYDRFNSKYDTTVYFRFFNEWTDNDPSNEDVFIADFSIYMESQDPLLQANFSYKLAFTDNKFLYAFTDKTICDQLLSWEWDFGDGIQSHEQNPQHLFSEAGVFKVQLTVKGLIEGEEVTNSIFKYIYISKFDYYHLGGHGYGDPPFPIDVGLAYLYHKDDDHVISAIDTARIDTLGYYYFYQIPAGNYCIKIQPLKQSEYYGVLMPTYYGNVVFWEDAEFFTLNETSWTYNIQLVEGTGMSNGIGKIAGIVTDESNKEGFSFLTSGIDVYLLDSNGEIMSSHYTDYYSEFQFDDIALDVYYISPEITGVPNTKTRIRLNEDLPEADEVSINIYTGEVVLDIADNAILGQGNISNPFPNPATSNVSINIITEFPGQITVEIIDLQGRRVLSNTERLKGGANNITLQTPGLENGIYFIRLRTENQMTERKFIVSQ